MRVLSLIEELRKEVCYDNEYGLWTKDVSLQKLLGLQYRSRYRLGDCAVTLTDCWGYAESTDLPAAFLRLLYRLGVDDDRQIRLSAAKALDVEPRLGHGKLPFQ